MKKSALFIGGTGVISSAVVAQALFQNWSVTLLNRGNTPPPQGVEQLKGDMANLKAVAASLTGLHFDVICDFIVFTPKEAQERIDLFKNHCHQYIFVSSATVYQKPPATYLMTESTPKVNPYWDYAQEKIACEAVYTKAFLEEEFPVTIVRPSYTYGDTSIPWVLNARDHRYSFIHRMIKGKPVVIPGDGSSFFTLTHNSDFAYAFVGLMGNQQALGHSFHITSHQAMTWDGYLQVIAKKVGATPIIKHLTSEQICTHFPQERGALLGDKAQTALFDLTKIKTFVPSYLPKVTFEMGITKTLAYYHSHPELMDFDREWDAKMDELVAAYG